MKQTFNPETSTITPGVKTPKEEMMGDCPPTRDEIREMQEKIQQLEMENVNLTASASDLKRRILETRYEV